MTPQRETNRQSIIAWAIWASLILGAAIPWGNARAFPFLVPVAAGLWFFRGRALYVAGAGILVAHLWLAGLIRFADRYNENQAYAPITAFVVDFGILAVVGTVGVIYGTFVAGSASREKDGLGRDD